MSAQEEQQVRGSQQRWIATEVCLPMTSTKKPFDPVVKIGLTVFVGGILLIAGGMFLSRPDRTIPPYSIGWQEDTIVAVHVPALTSDPEIETLIRRFRDVGVATHDFRTMKIRPTTPEDPNALYQEVTIYIFSNPRWTEPETLHRYVVKHEGEEEEAFRREFEQSVRGGLLYSHGTTTSWLGPIPDTTRPGKDQNHHEGSP